MTDLVKGLRDDLRRTQLERDHARYTCEQLKVQKQTLRSELRRVRAELRIAKANLEAAMPPDTP